MGYRNQLWTSNHPESGCIRFTEKRFGGGGFLEVGNFCVPLMWSLCFAGCDVHVERIPQHLAPDPGEPCYGASCDSPRHAVVERLERRLPSLKRLVHPVHHEPCELFVMRLKQSSEAYVHLEMTDLIIGEDDPSNGSWKKYWSGMLDGLDVPITRVRTGLARMFLGLGIPADWKYLAYKAMDPERLARIATPELEVWRLTGAMDVDELRRWQA